MAPKRKKATAVPTRRSKRLKQNDATESKEKEKASLLTIPAELRNRIYELALVESDEITVTSDLQPPGLLSTCCQIRSEAFKIFWFQNTFGTDIDACNGTLAYKFQLMARPYEESDEHHPGTVDLGYYFDYTPNWSNVLAWCKRVHEDDATRMMVPNENPGALPNATAAAHGIASLHRASPWGVCVQALGLLRSALGSYDKRWLED